MRRAGNTRRSDLQRFGGKCGELAYAINTYQTNTQLYQAARFTVNKRSSDCELRLISAARPGGEENILEADAPFAEALQQTERDKIAV